MNRRTWLVALAALLAGCLGVLSESPYPNELPGFRFHGKAKWSRLIPLQSSFEDVQKVLGRPKNFDEVAGYFYSRQGYPESKTSVFWYDLDENWRLLIYFVRFEDGKYAEPFRGKIESMDLIPSKSIRMDAVPELAKFRKKPVMAADAGWNEYTDGTGLCYEVYLSHTPPWTKRGPGDLNRIRYGASDEVVKKAREGAGGQAGGKAP